MEKITLLIWLFLPILLLGQIRTVTQTGIKKTMIRGDLTTLTWTIPEDVSTDSLLFIAQSQGDPVLRLTTGGGGLVTSLSGNKTTISATIYAATTDDWVAQGYLYDITDVTDSVTLVMGLLTVIADNSNIDDTVIAPVPYYTVPLSPPDHDTTFIIGYNADSTWDEVDLNTVRGLVSSTGTVVPDSVVYPYETIPWDKDASNDVTIAGTQTVTGIKTFSGDSTIIDGKIINPHFNVIGDVIDYAINGTFDTNIDSWNENNLGTPIVAWVSSGGGFTGALHLTTSIVPGGSNEGVGYIQASGTAGRYKIKFDINIIANPTLTKFDYYDAAGQSQSITISTGGTGFFLIDTVVSMYGQDNEIYFVQDKSESITVNGELYIDNIVFQQIGRTEINGNLISINGSTNGYYLPTDRGSTNQVLKLGADGVVSWQADVGGTSNISNADSLGGLPAADYALESDINNWSSGLFSGDGGLLKLGKTGREIYFNNGTHSDFWLLDYIQAPYNLFYSNQIMREFRTDYYNDTLKTFQSIANLTFLDTVGTGIWHPDGFSYTHNQNVLSVGDLPDSTTAVFNGSGVVGVQFQLQENNKTAGAKRLGMKVKGFEFKFGSTPYYTYPVVYGYYSDLTTNTPNLETAYHFYGKGNFPSYLGGDLIVTGSIYNQLNDDSVAFDDKDNNWTATDIGTALEELDEPIGGGVPNQTTGKVDWSQLVNVPAGFADNTDDGGGGGLDSVGADTSPTLGGDLELNDKNIKNITPTFTLSATELDYLDGVTSDIQTQFNTLDNYIDSNYVLTSETSAWDKNASNDLLKSDSSIYLTPSDARGEFLQISDVVGDTSDYTVNQLDSLLALAGTAIQNASMNSLAEFDTQVGITGTPSATTYWRGDNSWSTPTGSSGIDSVGTDTSPTLGGNLEINDKSLINTSPTFTVTATEVSYIDGLASNAQAQINALEDSIQALNSKFQSILDALEGCCDLSDVTPPSAPTSLVATADNDTAKIRLTWTDPTAEDLDSIRIYRAVVADTSAYTYLARVAAGVKAYTNTGLTENTAYWYKLKAVDDSSNVSGYSNRDSAKTFTSGGVSPLYTLDFEEGSLRPDWTTCGDSSDFSVATGGKYSGTYGMRINGGGDVASKTITGLDSVWVTLQMRLPDAAFNSSAQAYFSYFNSEPSIWGFQTITDSSTKAVYWVAGPNWSGHVVAATPIISRGVWHKIKLYFKKGATSVHGMWIDGTAFSGAGYVNGKITGTVNETVTSFVINLGGTTLSTTFIDIDDIKIYDEDPD